MWTKKRNGGESGAVIVEASIVGVLLLVIAAGVLEYAHLFYSATDISSAVRSAARAGSITQLSGEVGSDWKVIQALTGRSGDPRTNINRLVIYKAGSIALPPPAGCLNGTPPSGSGCNVYTRNDLSLSSTQLAAVSSSQRGWPEQDRIGGVDHLGIWVEISRPALFGLIPSPSTYTDQFVMLIAPPPTAITATESSPAGLGSPAPGWSGHDPTWPEEWWCNPPHGCTSLEGEGGGLGVGGGGGGST